MDKKHVHFLGIAGSGASAAAAIAQAQGYKVTGCDKNLSGDFIKPFDKNQLFAGHSIDHLKDIDILATTPAIFSLDPNNPELLAAKEQGIPVMTWQKFLGEILEKDKFVIGVCGTHGKSTTTAMIGLLLEDAGFDPTVELGAIVPRWKSNYRIGQGKYFVTEADEFNDNFLASKPDIAVVTTIEMDHPEYFKSFDAYKESFRKFLGQTKKMIVANMSDQGVLDTLGGKLKIIDYSQSLIDFELSIPGKHNILNASAVSQLGLALNLLPEVIKKSLQNFAGIGRRFEFMGNFRGAKVYSDFAHHPTEIKVTLQAAREKFPDQKITVIFQPHMFSRTYVLFDDFVRALQEAPVEKILIMDIYPSREVDTGLVNSKQLVETVDKGSVVYLPTEKEVLDKLTSQEGSGVLFFLGAGSTHELAKKLLNHA